MEIQWSLVLFTVLSGAGAWLFASAAIDEFKGTTKKTAFPAAILAVVLLAVGGICSVTHLSHPERMLAALGHPTAGIFLEALLLGILAVVAIVYAILVKREASAGARKVFAVLGIIAAIALTFACGASYMMSSHAMWDTITLPLAYLGTAAASGTALYLVLCAALKESDEAVSFAGLLATAGGVLALVLGIVYGVAGNVAFGDQAAIFWLAVVVCGGVAPIVFGYLASKKPASGLTYGAIAVVGALIGSIGLRCVMWLVGSALMSLFGVVL